MSAVPRSYAAVDLGASSGRVIVATVLLGERLNDTTTSEGVTLEEVHRFENHARDVDGSAVWDFPELFEETLTGLTRARLRAEEQGAEFAGIGIDSWGVDWVYVDPAGRPELPAHSYRGSPDPAPVLARRGLDAAEVYRRSGVADHAINSALRMGADAASRQFHGETPLFTPDVWVLWLTGHRGTDPTIASTSQLVEVRTGRFDPELLGSVGAGGLALPQLREVGSIAGTTTPAITARIGAAAPVRVFRVAGHDTASAFAFAEPDAPEALISSGTWSLVGAARAEPDTTDAARLGGFTNERGARGVLVLRNLTGLWMVQECARDWPATVSLTDLFAAVERLPFDPRTFDVADPSLFATGGMEARLRTLCAAVARPLDETPLSITHAVIDSLAAGYADGVQATSALLGVRFDCVRIVGGGSRNTSLCQRTADLTGLPVIAGPVEATAVGNLAVQLHADGVTETIGDAYAMLSAAHAPRIHLPKENP